MLKVYTAVFILLLHSVSPCCTEVHCDNTLYMPNDTVVYCDILYPRSAPVVCLMTLRVQKCV